MYKVNAFDLSSLTSSFSEPAPSTITCMMMNDTVSSTAVDGGGSGDQQEDSAPVAKKNLTYAAALLSSIYGDVHPVEAYLVHQLYADFPNPVSKVQIDHHNEDLKADQWCSKWFAMLDAPKSVSKKQVPTVQWNWVCHDSISPLTSATFDASSGILKISFADLRKCWNGLENVAATDNSSVITVKSIFVGLAFNVPPSSILCGRQVSAHSDFAVLPIAVDAYNKGPLIVAIQPLSSSIDSGDLEIQFSLFTSDRAVAVGVAKKKALADRTRNIFDLRLRKKSSKTSSNAKALNLIPRKRSILAGTQLIVQTTTEPTSHHANWATLIPLGQRYPAVNFKCSKFGSSVPLRHAIHGFFTQHLMYDKLKNYLRDQAKVHEKRAHIDAGVKLCLRVASSATTPLSADYWRGKVIQMGNTRQVDRHLVESWMIEAELLSPEERGQVEACGREGGVPTTTDIAALDDLLALSVASWPENNHNAETTVSTTSTTAPSASTTTAATDYDGQKSQLLLFKQQAKGGPDLFASITTTTAASIPVPDDDDEEGESGEGGPRSAKRLRGEEALD